MKQLTFSLTLHTPSSLLDDYNLILYLKHDIISILLYYTTTYFLSPEGCLAKREGKSGI